MNIQRILAQLHTKAMQPRQTRGLTQLGLQSLHRRNNVVSYKCDRVNMDVVGKSSKSPSSKNTVDTKVLVMPILQKFCSGNGIVPKEEADNNDKNK